MSALLGDELLDAICGENLAVYRVSPIRLEEDVSQEAQISGDYRGRIIYELLQNADDAMSESAALDDRIVFRLTDEELWVGNSGRPLTEADVKGLCGIGASSKRKAVGQRRASIGHKGMGFKSVLEITDAPEVSSTTHSLRMSADFTRERLASLVDEMGLEVPVRMPIMRFPAPLSEVSEYWERSRQGGINALFRFPLRPDLGAEKRQLLAERLLALPVTAILFLKHLERVEVLVDTSQRQERFAWRVTRERQTSDGWKECSGLTESGLYRIKITTRAEETREFLLAHDADVPIGEHRGGLDSYGWEGVKVTEVSVATLLDGGGLPVPTPDDWRKFHVFLPTSEPCPYPLLVNGAFVSDLSRQEIRIGDGSDDYNGFLMHRVAALFRDKVVPELEREGASASRILHLLDRDVEIPCTPPATNTAHALYEAMRDELGSHPMLALVPGEPRCLNELVVPPLVPQDWVGPAFRDLLSDDATFGEARFPDGSICASSTARIAVDHGAKELGAGEAAEVLGAADLREVALEEHPTGGVLIDPVLRVLEGLWDGLTGHTSEQLADAVRAQPLFPTGLEDGIVRRQRTQGLSCFYPPRSLKGTVPLGGLSFLMQDLCWGALNPRERNELLHDELLAWQALFDIREFKFPDVMRASVLPALELDPDEEAQARLRAMQDLSALAAICQLAGTTPNPARPLRYERLGSNRALFNLARLRVPCRFGETGELEWRPAYEVYFGDDWIADASVEHVLEAVRRHQDDEPKIPILAQPELFDGLLSQFRDLQDDEVEADEADEVSIDEDEEAPPDQADRSRWLDFLTWIGVNRVLRPVHFHDVEDRGTGWLTTRDFAHPQGWAFENVTKDDLWNDFREEALRLSAEKEHQTDGVPYFYRVHDLEHIIELITIAAADETADVARAVFSHLARNWPELEPFVKAEAAVVPRTNLPGNRTPPKARDEELVEIGDDLWVRRLRANDWCPTTHGPRRPNRAWLRTPEVERRFNRPGSDAGALLPLLDVELELVQGRVRNFLYLIGTRLELTAPNFEPDDASVLLTRIKEIYVSAAETRTLTEATLRQVLRPAYRNLMELLPGAETTLSPAYSAGVLRGAPLLVHDGARSYRFEPSDSVYYTDRASTRERLGSPENLWTFILEATPAARAPLGTLMGVRVLEEELTWSPSPGDSPFDDEGLEEFHRGIRVLAPYVLARLGVERQEERQAAQDKRRLQAFVDAVQPVSDLSVTCRLGEREIGGTLKRSSFVNVARRGEVTAFVRWGENPWPPAPEEGEALATALSDLVDSAHLEAFLALISASSHEGRLKLLRLAGAPTDVEELWKLEPTDEPGPGQPTPEPPRTAGEPPSEEPPSPPSTQPPQEEQIKRPLYRPEELLIQGMPVLVRGDSSSVGKDNGGGHAQGGHAGSGGRGYGGITELNDLDALGMYVALSYEQHRLRRLGIATAEIFDPTLKEEQPAALVFDVSTVGKRTAARMHSSLFRSALEKLERHDISAQAPGFDILTLSPNRPDGIDRLIELKSSGVNARVQEMSWNEWKSAKNSALRRLFYLYLVGNLRSDLGDAVPFIRTVHDPFATIWAQEVEQTSETRRVQLQVGRFDAAEHLDLTVRDSSPETKS